MIRKHCEQLSGAILGPGTFRFPIQTHLEQYSVVSRWRWLQTYWWESGASLWVAVRHFALFREVVLWWEQVKQQAYSSSLFVLWHCGVYSAPQRHGSELRAVARSHGGGQGTAAYWHPRCCPLNTLGERKAGSLLGWHYFFLSHESAAHSQREAGVFCLAAFFVCLTVWCHLVYFRYLPLRLSI